MQSVSIELLKQAEVHCTLFSAEEVGIERGRFAYNTSIPNETH